MRSHEKAGRAYRFLTERARAGTPFTAQALADETGWTPRTVKAYLSNQWRELVEGGAGEFRARPELLRMSEGEFRALAAGTRPPPGSYRRVRYREVVSYEFLLPFTRQEELTRALDALFFADTLLQRAREIGLPTLRAWLPPDPDETESAYLERLCGTIADLFGGYSVTHLDGRYRAGAVRTREEAARLFATEQPYLVDEKTASVRFLIPLAGTRVEGGDLDEEEREGPLPGPVAEEIRRVRRLFFHFFVEAVVQRIRGEDEIWLVEETGRGRTLYTWQRG